MSEVFFPLEAVGSTRQLQVVAEFEKKRGRPAVLIQTEIADVVKML
jgi:hypothetical protein